MRKTDRVVGEVARREELAQLFDCRVVVDLELDSVAVRITIIERRGRAVVDRPVRFDPKPLRRS